MFSIPENHKFCNVRTHAAQVPGEANQPDDTGINLQAENTNGLFERNNKGVLLIEVSAVATNGDLTIDVEHKNDEDSDWSTYGSIANIAAVGDYYTVLNGLKKNVRFEATVADANVTWGAKFVTFDALKRPVKQVDFTNKAFTAA